MAEKNALVDILKSMGENLVDTVKQSTSLSNILKGIGSEVMHKTAHGAHELSAAIFTGSAHVMYPRGTHDDKSQTAQAPAVEAQAIEEQSRGGRSM